MIINSSKIGMSSEHTYESHFYFQSLSRVMTKEAAATLELSDEAKSYMEQLDMQVKEQERKQSELLEENEKRNLQKTLEHLKASQAQNKEEIKGAKSEKELEVEMLRQLLQALKNMRQGKYTRIQLKRSLIRSMSRSLGSTASTSQSVGGNMERNLSFAGTEDRETVSVIDLSSNRDHNSAQGVRGTWWTKVTATQTSFTEREETTFRSVGTAITADGREINFNVDLSMSRAFAGITNELTAEDYFVTDPLVINLDTNVAAVTDQKFFFDLDSDGKEDEISFAGEGSGFLALDKNNDGKINDGSELFGTTSGDGFKDLAAYDEDGNGWIDEADSIFDKLRVWTKDGEGNDRLIDLKTAGVGAMYLGSANTQFQLNDKDTNQANGIIRKTGIYLKESGAVGTMQHVDLVL